MQRWSASPASWRSATCSTASPAQLSGGQRQRVALGRAMVRQPDIFLMDEPLSNLDAKLRVTMRAELRRFHIDLSATTIYVTHDQLEAMTMSDMIAVMHGGIVQQFGTPAEVYGRPANLFVAGFIGSPPMNFITGTLGGGDAAGVRIAGLHAAAAGRSTDRRRRPRGRAGGSAAGPRRWCGDARSPRRCAGASGWWSCSARRSWSRSTLGERRRMTVQVRAETNVNVDDPVGVQLDPQRVHLFDAKSGIALRA